jgi:plasmid maintenance system antidote protein VapI
MTAPGYPFVPDWTMSPAAILVAELGERRVTAAEFAEQSGLGAARSARLLGGDVRIDGPVAAGIARVLGTSGTMWMNAQMIYDDALARGAKDVSGEFLQGPGKLRDRACGKDQEMGELDAAARAAGYEVEALVRMTHRADALLQLPGEDEVVRVLAAEVAAGAGVPVEELADLRVVVTVRESRDVGRVLSGFRRVGE